MWMQLGPALLLILLGAPEEAKNDSPPAQPAPSTEAPKVDQAKLDQEFSEKLSGAVFSGMYSVFIDGKERPSEMEKYTISKVTKLKDDNWLFAARIQYGKTDLTIPMTLQVKWAGDTPVITLTETTIPGLGTFTSRVLIYGDRYAGTWQHNKVGGHLWGRIEKTPKPAEEPSREKTR
jgi:hypothetical protein